jgi:putative ABC transport system permease protein
VAEVAGLAAAHRASRIRPTTALGEVSTDRRVPSLLRLVLGVGALGGAVVLSVLAVRQSDVDQQLNQAQFALLTCLAGAAFLGPYLVMFAERLLRLPLRLAGGQAGRLASAQIWARSRRMASAAVAIAMPVGFAAAITIIDSTEIHAATTEGPERLAASMVVTAAGPGVSPSVLGAIRAEPGVSDAIGVVPTTVYLPGAETTAAEAVTAGPLDSVLRLAVTSGSLARFGPGDIAVSQLEAGSGGITMRVGETITTYLADGTPYRARIVAIYSRSMGFADALIPATAGGGGHLGSTSLAEVLVSTSPPAAAKVPAELAALGRRYPGLQAASRSVANAQYELLDSQSSYLNNLLLLLIGLLAAIALVNVLVLATLQGGGELSLLRRVGATSRQLLAMTAWQTAEVAVTGIVLGAAACAAAVCAVVKALTGSWVPYVSTGTTAVIIGAVVTLTGLATLVPTAMLIRPRRRA